MMCEKCWGDAYMRTRREGGYQSDHYWDIVAERDNNDDICTPEEQAGQFWDSELCVDIRLIDNSKLGGNSDV